MTNNWNVVQCSNCFSLKGETFNKRELSDDHIMQDTLWVQHWPKSSLHDDFKRAVNFSKLSGKHSTNI
jgi:hypothetical protein